MKQPFTMIIPFFRPFMLVFVAIFCFVGSSQAQLLEGQKAIELAGGKSDLGTIISGAFTDFLSPKFSIKGEGFFESASPYQFSYHNFGVNALARYNVLNLNNVFYLTPHAGLSVNYDKLSPVKAAYSSSLNYGLKMGVEAEAFLNEQFSFVAFFNQLLLVKSNPFGRERYDYGIGIRLYIGN